MSTLLIQHISNDAFLKIEVISIYTLNISIPKVVKSSMCKDILSTLLHCRNIYNEQVFMNYFVIF